MIHRTAKTVPALLPLLLIVLAVPALANTTTGAVKGRFDGKVMCEDGKKHAEFKSEPMGELTYSTSEAIKRRIDAVTWPSSSETETFTEREKEKVELQHALKMLKELDCDAAEAPAAPPETEPPPPQLTPKPSAPPLQFIQ